MNVLVTGGSGYIGSVLVPEFLSQNYKVTVLDSFLYNQTSLLGCCHHENLKIIKGDIRDNSLLKKLIPKVDAIIHLAAYVGAPLCQNDPINSQSTNVGAVGNILKIKSSSQPLLYPCTNSGYGIGQEGIFCTEESPLKPISLYGRQKVEAEKLVLDSQNSLSFRFATLFGTSPRMRLDLLVNDFTYRAVHDSTLVLFEAHFKRNYLHVRDAARAFLHGLKNFDSMKGRPYNVGLSDANLNKEELCELILKQVPDFKFIKSEIGKDPDKRNYIVSNERVESTGYQTTLSLSDGVKELKKAFIFLKENQHANV